jgi:hypothetical protein
VDDIASWVNRLRETKGIVAEELDCSIESLERIDLAFAEGRLRAKGKDVFECLVAYTGEVIRVATEGSWMAEQSRDGITFEPVVVVGSRKVYPAVIVYKQLELPVGGSPRPLLKFG